MVRHKLDSVNDCARQGYNLRIRCLACGHVVDASAAELMMQLHKRRSSLRIEALEDRMRCARCGARKAHVVPVLAEF